MIQKNNPEIVVYAMLFIILIILIVSAFVVIANGIKIINKNSVEPFINMKCTSLNNYLYNSVAREIAILKGCRI